MTMPLIEMAEAYSCHVMRDVTPSHAFPLLLQRRDKRVTRDKTTTPPRSLSLPARSFLANQQLHDIHSATGRSPEQERQAFCASFRIAHEPPIEADVGCRGWYWRVWPSWGRAGKKGSLGHSQEAGSGDGVPKRRHVFHGEHAPKQHCNGINFWDNGVCSARVCSVTGSGGKGKASGG